MNKRDIELLSARLREREENRLAENLDLLGPIQRLPYWARMSLCLVILWGGFNSLLRNRQPGEPHQAFWFTLLVMVASFVLSELLRPKPNVENARPVGLGDFNFPTATEGRPIPLFWGRNQIKGPNVIWYGDLFQEPIIETIKTGMWSSAERTLGFKYHVGVQMGFARGPGAVLKRVWIGDVEVFSGTVVSGGRFDIDKPELFGGQDLGTGGVQATIDFYGGETNQPVNAYLDDPSRQQVAQATEPDTAPRYTGMVNFVAREMTSAAPSASNRGAYFGNSTSVKPWKIELERFPGIFSGQTAGHHKIGSADCNPINVIYEVLTNTEWGFGFPAADIDVGVGNSFELASDALQAEVNGFSMVLDSQIQAVKFLEELERQIDGSLFLDHQTGKWRIQLVRQAGHAQFGYDINTVPQFNDSNIKSIKDFTRGGWEDTTNQITVQFDKRADDYKLSFALAQDMGNALIQGGGSVTTVNPVSGAERYPGVKLSALAANIAWRELRGQSYPLARATFTMTREFWDVRIGDVVAWTTAKLGFVKLPMRITRINYGQLQNNKMEVQAVQDVFSFAAASYAAPPDTGWVFPEVTLVAFPSAEQYAEESPRAILVRDPDFGGDDTISKVWCAARRQGDESAFKITQRNSSGVPAGSYTDSGSVFSFMRIGELTSDLAAGTAYPKATVTVTPDPDNQTDIESSFDDSATLQDLGVGLVHLVKIDNEYMLVKSAADNGGDVDLENVYRGALDSAQQDHTAGAGVLLLHVGAGLAETIFPGNQNVDIELRMRSYNDQFAGAVTKIGLAMDSRAIRPYPAAALLYNGSSTVFDTIDLEGDGAGLNGVGFDIDWRRRRFDTEDEVSSLLSDDTGVLGSTEYRVTVIVDPDGSPSQAFQSAWVAGPSIGTFPTQAQIANEAAAGTDISVGIETRHDIAGATDVESRYDLVHKVTPTSTRSSQFYLGGDLQGLTISNSYVVASATAHNITIGAAYSTSTVRFRVNGGIWTAVISPGGTTGATGVLAISDTLEVQHTSSETPARQFVEIDDGTNPVAYGVFTDGS